MFRFATVLLLVAVGIASAQRFAKHETIRALPEACQVSSGSNDWASSSQSRGGRQGSSSYSTSSTTGPCKLLPPVMSEQGEGYEFCLKCKAGEKHGVTAETLAQSIRQVVERKLKRNNQFVQSRQAKLNLVIDGVKQPIDLTRVLANTPEVLEKVDDVFFFFPNGQIGRIEFEHGQPDELERITCRAPCRGGPRQTGSQSSSSWSRKDQDIDEEEDQDNEPTYSSHSSSSTYQQKNKNKKYGASAYSYGEDSMTTPAYGQRSSSRYGSSSTYGQRSANAGRYGDNINKQRRYSSQHQEEEEDDK